MTNVFALNLDRAFLCIDLCVQLCPVHEYPRHNRRPTIYKSLR